MPNANKILAAALGNAANVRFTDLVKLVLALGDEHARTNGSHQIYTAADLPMINLQKVAGMAKPYQVKQVLAIIEAHDLKLE